jgi:alanine dehydrogenase
MDPTSTLFLRSDELADLVSPTEAVAAVRDAYRQVGEGAPAEPRTRLDNAEPPGFLTGYLAILPETGVMGGYTYAAGFGAADAHFALPLFEAESGELVAMLDGASINPLKTGAAGAVGVDELAREDANTLGLVGSGTQARGQLRATATVREFETVRVFSPTPTSREAFAETMDGELDATVEPVDSVETAVSDTDVVITATRAQEPVFDGADLSAGSHVTAMGQYHRQHREIDAETVARSTYVPDLRARIESDAGAYIQAVAEGAIDEDHVHAELGEVVAGDASGRTSEDEVTLFDSGGTAIETLAVANLCYERARERGRGEEIDFAPASEAMADR